MAKQVRAGYVIEGCDLVVSGYGNVSDEKLTPLQSIKRFCCECQGGHYHDWRMADGTVLKKEMPYDEVRKCRTTTCYLYPYRMGRRPKAHASTGK